MTDLSGYTRTPGGFYLPAPAIRDYAPPPVSAQEPPGECRLCRQIINGNDTYLRGSPNAPRVPDKFRVFPSHAMCWENVKRLYCTGAEYKETVYCGW